MAADEPAASTTSESRRSQSPPDASDASLVADDRGRFVDCNEAAVAALGFTRGELLAKTVWDLTPAGYEADGLALWQDFIRVGFHAGIYSMVRKDGVVAEYAYRALANKTTGRHQSWFRPIETGRGPFGRSVLPRPPTQPR